jgi:hypothetical protein
MEDWEDRLRAFEARLREWKRSVEENLERLKRERLPRRFLRKHRPGELQPLVEEARRAAGLAILGELAALFDAIADRYQEVLPQERARMRARVGIEETVFELFWDYVSAGPQFVRDARSDASLRRALAALSIHDLRTDIEQVNELLAELVIVATQARLDWRAALASVAKVSNRGTGGGGAHMREHLEGFERSDYFARHVRGKLAELARLGAGGGSPSALAG